MTPAAGASSTLPPHPARLTHGTWLGWAAAAAVAGLLAGAGAAPLATLGLLILLAVLVGVLASPFLFLWILTATAGVGMGWTDGAALELAGRTINVNGLRWLLVISACMVILLRTPREPLPRPLRPWLLFVAFSAAGILWSTDPMEGVKTVLLYAAPLLIALVTIRAVRTEDAILALRGAVFIGVVLALVVGLGAAATGNPLDPEGRMLQRQLGTYMLPAAALVLAAARFRGLRHGAWLLLLLALMVPTLSRTSIGVLYVLGLLTAAASASLGRRIGAGVLLTVITIAALQYAPLRERIFSNPRQGFTRTVAVVDEGGTTRLEVAGLQLTGRGVLWLRTWAHAAERPALGHGTGSATHFLGRQQGLSGLLHPHNEYLRLFHDGGFLGVGVLLFALSGAVVGLRRLGRTGASPLTRELAWAALLSWVALGITSVVDNSLGYFVLLTHTVFLVTALAVCAARLPARTEPAWSGRTAPRGEEPGA